MLPNRCSVKEEGKDCVNPPEFIISVGTENDEYMLGLTCQRHKDIISQKLNVLQSENKIPKGKIKFTSIKTVGTECIRLDPDKLIQL